MPRAIGRASICEPLRALIKAAFARQEVPSKENVAALEEAFKRVVQSGLRLDEDVTDEELDVKSTEASGGFANIGFVEERYADLVRLKRGSDGTHDKNNLNEALNLARKRAHSEATRLYSRLAYADTPQTSLDVLKRAVDDRLLDIAPQQAEQLMLAFRGAASDRPEEWSHALTSCRRCTRGARRRADASHP